MNLSLTVAGFDVARRVPLKSRVNWNAGCEALSGLNWRSIFRSPTVVQDFDREVSRIMERFVPMITVRRRGEDAAWFDGDCRRAFKLKQSAYHCWCRNHSAVTWDLFCQGEVLKDSIRLGRLVTLRIAVGTLMIEPLSGGVHLKGHVFGAESDIPPLCLPVGALVSDPAGKAELLIAWFDSKQSRTLFSHRRPVNLALHSVALLSEHVRLSGTCWILILMVEWTCMDASLFFSEDCFCSCPETESSFS